jgi:hypothetical protein
LNYAGINDTAVFVTSGLAIIPLAALLGFATEEIAMKIGGESAVGWSGRPDRLAKTRSAAC